MFELFKKLLSILSQVGLAELLKILDAVQKFLAGEEAEIYVTLKNGVRLKVVVDLSPLSLRIEVL